MGPRSKRSVGRELAFARGTFWGLLVWVAGFLVTYQVLFRLHVLRFTIEPYDALAWTIFSIGVLGPLLFYTTWRGRQQRQHQIDEGGQNANSNWQMWALDPERPGFRAATYGTQACLVFGSCSWLLVHALDARDSLLIALLPALCLFGWLLSAALIVRRPAKTASIRSNVMWCLGLVNLLVVNSRWDSWSGGDPVLQFSHHLAPWTVNYLIVFFFAIVQLLWWLRRTFIATPDARRATRIAVGLYFALLLSGSVLLAVSK